VSDARKGNGVVFDLVRRAIRRVPAHMRGKARLSRLLAGPFVGRSLVRIPDRFGNQVWCPSLKEPIAVALFADGAYEPDTIDRIVSSLPPEGAYLDVGANVGTLALAVAALRPDARIVCVEGLPEIAALLRRNVEDNRRSNVVVVEALAGADDDVEVPFYAAPSTSFGMGSIGPQFGVQPVRLRQRRLDSVLDELGIGHVDVVKVDIEGAEVQALRGLMRRLAGDRPPVVIFEFADWAETRIAGLCSGYAQRLLLAMGYRILRLGPGEHPGSPLAEPMTQGQAMLVALPREAP
jgi:FkbM family methyltransferase